jgi:hypothetical protein
MKNSTLLLLSLIIFCNTTAKRPLSTQAWGKQYGVKQLRPTEKSDLASGLYYLLKSKGDEKTVPSMVHDFFSGKYQYNCRGAYLKAYEGSLLASKDSTSKDVKWTKTLLPYYAEVVDALPQTEAKITFGPDKGKNLPASFFELDRAINPRPQPITSIFQVSTPGLSLKIQKTILAA